MQELLGATLSFWSNTLRYLSILCPIQYINVLEKRKISLFIIAFAQRLIYSTSCSRFQVCPKSNTDTTLLRGCWKLVLQPLKLNLTWTLLKYTPLQIYIGNEIKSIGSIFRFYSHNAKQSSIFSLSQSHIFRRNQDLIKELSSAPPAAQDLHFPTKYSQPFLVQFIACFWKQHWSYWRNPQYNVIRFFMTTVIGLIFGVIFWDKGNKM